MRVLLLFLLSLNLFAAPQTWMDVAKLQDYKLTSPIELKVENKKIVLDTNTTLKVTEIVGLDFINVTLFETRIMGCDFHNASSELEILDFEYQGELTVVGYELSSNCHLELFIENVDLRKKSIFNLAEI